MYFWQKTVFSGSKVEPGHSEAEQARPVQPSHRGVSLSLARILSAICDPDLMTFSSLLFSLPGVLGVGGGPVVVSS